MKKSIFRLAAGVVLSFIMAISFAGESAAEIKFGILPRLSAVELFMMFNPLTEYLAKEVGEKVSLVIPKDFDAFKAAVRSGQVDLGFANSLIYVQLKEEMILDPMAVSAEQKAGTRFRGIIIARKDSGIKRLRDLKGKRLVFVEKDSAAGYFFQILRLKNAGLDIHKDFVTLPFAKKHGSVLMAVLNKAADAGGMREDDFEKMKDKADLSQLMIVAYTDYYPNWPVFAAPSLKREAAAKVKAALLKLNRNDPEAARILGSAKLAGFSSVSDRDYDKLRQAARLAGAL